MYEDYFAKQLKAYREARGLTLQELADILHTSKQVLSRYETGQRVPKISVANEFASILGLPLSYFMPDAPHWEDHISIAYNNPPGGSLGDYLYSSGCKSCQISSPSVALYGLFFHLEL